jgi:hypothetical protein
VGKTHQEDYFVKSKWSDENDNLEHFQKLMTSLITQTRAACPADEECPGSGGG